MNNQPPVNQNSGERPFSPTNPFSNVNDITTREQQPHQQQQQNSQPQPQPMQSQSATTNIFPPASGAMLTLSMAAMSQSLPRNNEMADAAARLANLQLGATTAGNQAQSPLYQQQQQQTGAYAAGYGGAHMTAAPVTVSATPQFNSFSSSQVRSANQGPFAPGYGPPPAVSTSPANNAPAMYGSASPVYQQGQAMGPQTVGGGQPVQQFYSSANGPQPLVLPPLLGPLLQFVDVDLESATWRGSVLVLTNESLLPHAVRPPTDNAGAVNTLGSAMHAGPTPGASTLQAASLHVPIVEVWDDGVHGPGTGKPKTFTARAIYTEPTFKYTFWRADIALPLPQEREVDVVYQVYWSADEHAIQSPSARPSFGFRLPAQALQWRTCVTSNAQFSRRTGEAARAGLRGSGPVFGDLLAKHRANPFHVWLGTGGQFSGEGVWDDCEHALRPFLMHGLDNQRRSHVPWTADMAAAVDRWYFLEYLRQWFGVGAVAASEAEGQAFFRQAAESIPYSFTPDCEIFPEYGSYTPLLHFAPVFGGVRHVGAKYFALFQAHTTPTLAHNEHGFLAEGFNSIKKLGPHTAILTLDTRTERQPAGIIDRHSYDMLFGELEARVPATASNLIVVTANPVIFPRTKSFESILRSANSTGLASIISYAVSNTGNRQARNDWVAKDRFGEPVAVTKLNDFWTAATHKSERAFLVHSLQEFSRRRSVRVTFASGHVNCLSSGHFRTYTDTKFDARWYPEQRGFVSDYRSMIQLTVSGIVQEPADSLTLRAYHFAGKSAPFDMHTEEALYRTFNADVNQLAPPNGNQKLLARRSFGIIIEHDFDNDRRHPGLLSFFYVENETCTGTATPYIINIPPLRYPQLPSADIASSGVQPAPFLGNNAGRPQLRPSVTYRGYTADAASAGGSFAAPAVLTGAAASAAAAAGANARASGSWPTNEASRNDALADDPYAYDVPGYEGVATGGGRLDAKSMSPPPYTPVPPIDIAAQGGDILPPRTDGTYSSSYEHTAAWVQGSASHTTGGSEPGVSAMHTGGQQQPRLVQNSIQQQMAYSQAVPPQAQAQAQAQAQQQQYGQHQQHQQHQQRPAY